MSNSIIGSQGTSGNVDRKLDTRKFNNAEIIKLFTGGLSDAELEEIEYDTRLSEEGTSGTSGINQNQEEVIDEFLGGDECDYLEFDKNSVTATSEELKNIIGLNTCKKLPESLKDQKNNKVQISKSVGDIDGKTRIKIEVKNNDQDNCVFIESIKVITGTSNSSEQDAESFSNVVSNSSLTSEDDILTFLNSKVEISENTPSSLIDGIVTSLPPCLTANNDTIGILLGPDSQESNEIRTGELYKVNTDLPPGSANLLGFIGSTGTPQPSPGMIAHIHAEWADVGTGTPKYWLVGEFTQWFKNKYKKDPINSAIKLRTNNGRGKPVFPGINGKAGVAAYFNVNDLLKFVDIDMLPLKDQIDGKIPVPATINDFLEPDRNYAQYREKKDKQGKIIKQRYHYAIDVYPNKADRAIKGKAVRRIFLKPGVSIESVGGSSDGSTGNSVQLRHPDGNAILLYHLSALWDNKQKVYYTYANLETTLNQYNGGAATLSKINVTNSAPTDTTKDENTQKKSPCGVSENFTSYSIDVDVSKYKNIPVWVLIEVNGTFEQKTFLQYFSNNEK